MKRLSLYPFILLFLSPQPGSRAQSGPTPWVNVRQAPYSAVGDGSHDDTSAFNAATAAVPGGTVVVPAGRYKITGPIKLTNGVIIAGTGYNNLAHALSGSVLVLSSPSAGLTSGKNAINNVIRDIALDCRESAATAIRIAGEQDGGTVDAVHATIENVETDNCKQAGVSLYHTYGTRIMGLNAFGNETNLQFEDGYNNDTTIINSDFSQSSGSRSVYLGAHVMGLEWNGGVCEANSGGCIEIGQSVHEVRITGGIDFEDNCIRKPGSNIFFSSGNLDAPSRNVEISYNNFSSGGDACDAISAANVLNLTVRGNHADPRRPQLGELADHNNVILGAGTINASIAGNHELAVLSDALIPVGESDGPILFTNLLKSSVDLKGTFLTPPDKWVSAAATMSQDGTLFDDMTRAWALTFDRSASASNPSAISQTTYLAPPLPATAAGHIWKCGMWVRTNAGNAFAWINLYDESVLYSGSPSRQPFLESVDANWKYIGLTAAFSRADQGRFVGCGVSAYPRPSGSATTLYIAHPQLCMDTLAQCNYVTTTSNPVLNSPVPVSTTVYAQLPQCGPETRGYSATITDAKTNQPGGPLQGGGSALAMVACDGKNWSAVGR